MKIIMTKNQDGSKNGITVERFREGKKYDLPEQLANVFLKLRVAVLDKTDETPKADLKKVEIKEVKIEKKEEPKEQKMEKAEYKNKMAAPKSDKKKKR